ncbi:MAG: hypothetical protein CVU55_11925 [Deltaproteobacteria bacterium HGW-Deltaproteobacteria-13]|nr:MAG: hypothetical protein CVU55_11925 [Deltaproteobacteria bacterium HGW-Deltaproteobacteria-13]
MIILLLIAAVNTALTYQRNKIWKNDYTLWSDCLTKSPKKARVNNALGFALFKNNEFEKAIYYYNKASLLSPDYFQPYYNRGNVYAKLGKDQPAIENFNKAITLQPDCADTYYHRGTFYGKTEQYQLAIEDFNNAIRLNPNYIKSYNNRGIAHTRLGLYQKAIDDFNEAIRMKPDYADAWNNRAFVYLILSDNISCCRDARKACELGNCKTLESAAGKRICR